MMEIMLTQQKVALVDDDMFLNLTNYTWCAQTRKHTSYALRFSSSLGTRNCIYMHQEILGKIPYGFVTDHINGNGLDNRKENLRIVSHRGNNQNRHVIKTSKFPGVCWHMRDKKWYARILIAGKSRGLGYFNTEMEAAFAYQHACEIINDTVLFGKGE